MIKSGLLGTGRGAARADDAQETPTQSHISLNILFYEEKHARSQHISPGNQGGECNGGCYRSTSLIRNRTLLGPCASMRRTAGAHVGGDERGSDSRGEHGSEERSQDDPTHPEHLQV